MKIKKKLKKMKKFLTFLKAAYGKEIYDESIEKLSNSEFKDLCENIKNGIPIATPVFDGAKEARCNKNARVGKTSKFRSNNSYGMVGLEKNLIDK